MTAAERAQLAAIAGQLDALTAEVAKLRQQWEAMDKAAVILARAAGHESADRPAPVRRARPRHLRVVDGGR